MNDFLTKLSGVPSSKTMWFAGAALMFFETVAANLDKLKPFLTAPTMAIVGVVLSGAVATLRWVTTQSLADKKTTAN